MITGIAKADILIFGIFIIVWCLRVLNDGKFFASLRESTEEKDAELATEYSPDHPSGRQRKQMMKCAMDYCHSLNFRNTNYCWKHQDAKPHETDGPAWWEEGGGQSS